MKYWPSDNFSEEKPRKRSLKRKLAIVGSFLIVLTITPSIIFGLLSLDLSKTEKVSAVNDAVSLSAKPKEHIVTVEEPKNSSTAEVINNDSYWKISKRVCGTGKYYLSIQAQNNGKALYKGDIVIAACSY